MPRRLEPDPELDELIRELNASANGEAPANRPGSDEQRPDHALATHGVESQPRPAAVRWRLPAVTSEGAAWLRRLLARAREMHASDLLFVVGASPSARLDGGLHRIEEAELSPVDAATLAAALLPDDRRSTLQERGYADFSLRDPQLGRFRCNVHRERGHWSAAVRLFPAQPPELASLNLPQGLARLADMHHGLVLVTGPTGCGKSTTLAALTGRILARRQVHLVTIEDPVEYEHAHGRSIVQHIEIGRDAGSYAEALRSVLRQDPDVILIGEMRDAESISIAITAAETGHLVLSTLHTGDAPQTIHRILDSYPAVQKEAIRAQLAASLAGVASQQLLPRRDSNGRVPAVEILVATPAVRNLVRQGRIEQLRSQLTLERAAGMLEFDRSLAELARRGLVDPAEARVRARSPEDFEQHLRLGG